jgi:hypothetical protein
VSLVLFMQRWKLQFLLWDEHKIILILNNMGPHFHLKDDISFSTHFANTVVTQDVRVTELCWPG